MSSIDLAEKAFQNVIIRLLQRQQLFTAVHESYNKDDDGQDERHHGEGVHGEVDHDLLQWRQQRGRNDALVVGSFSARFITTMVKIMISANAGRRIMIMTTMIIVSHGFYRRLER